MDGNGETTISQVKVWNHPTEATILEVNLVESGWIRFFQQLEIFRFVKVSPWTWHQNSYQRTWPLHYSRVFTKKTHPRPTPFSTGFHLTDYFELAQNNVKIHTLFIVTSLKKNEFLIVKRDQSLRPYPAIMSSNPGFPCHKTIWYSTKKRGKNMSIRSPSFHVNTPCLFL